MNKPKDIKAGDWDMAFKVLENMPCPAWKRWLKCHDTLREALLRCHKSRSENVSPLGARLWFALVERAPIRRDIGYISMEDFTNEEIDGIVAHLRAKYLRG